MVVGPVRLLELPPELPPRAACHRRLSSCFLVDFDFRRINFYSAFGRSIKQLARAEQVEYVDLLPVFRRESKRLYRDAKKYLYWADDTHWNAEGQALGARTIAQRLRTMGS